jgi:hypothetical protein
MSPMNILRPKRRYRRVDISPMTPVIAPVSGARQPFRLKRSGRPHNLFGLEPATASY